jgi:hypothetical protein
MTRCFKGMRCLLDTHRLQCIYVTERSQVTLCSAKLLIVNKDNAHQTKADAMKKFVLMNIVGESSVLIRFLRPINHFTCGHQRPFCSKCVPGGDDLMPVAGNPDVDRKC